MINETYSGKTLTIMYESKSGVISKRTIHILVVEDGYIVAFCYLRKKIRKFKKDKILAWEISKRREELLS